MDKQEKEIGREHLAVILSHIITTHISIRPLTERLKFFSYMLQLNLDEWDCFKSFMQAMTQYSVHKHIKGKYLVSVPTNGIYKLANTQASHNRIASGEVVLLETLETPNITPGIH